MLITEFVIVGLFGTIYTVTSAQPTVVPKSVIAQVGTGARFNCTTTHNEPVYWTTRPYGSTATNDIYIGDIFLLDDYGTSGRFSVEVNSTHRRYDLLIQDVKQSDGGVYICTDERGLGKKTPAELIVWDTLTCKQDQQQDSYMGYNAFGLEQEALSFTCKSNYWGNIRPHLMWSVGGKKFNGTQGTESGIASSSLILAATSKLDGVKVTCEAVIKDSSPEDTRTGVLWTSDTIRAKYAVLKKEQIKECPDVETILHCNPSCSYKLETVNGTQRCAVSYSTGKDVEVIHFYQSNVHNSKADAVYWFGMGALFAVCSFLLISVVIVVCCLVKKRRREKKKTQRLR